MKTLLFTIFLLLTIPCLSQDEIGIGKTPSPYDRRQDVIYYDNNAYLFGMLDIAFSKIDSLVNTGMDREKAIGTLYERTDLLKQQIKSFKLDSVQKSNMIAAMRIEIDDLKKQMLTALKVIQIQAKAGETKFTLVNGVYVFSIDPILLQKVNSTEAAMKKIKEIE